MVSRGIKILISCLLVCVCVACSKENNNVLKSVDFSTDLKTVSDFKWQQATDLLKDSIALPHLEGAIYTPLALNEDNKLFGEAVKEDDSITLTQLDLNLQVYEDLYESKIGRISVLCASDKYVIFSEYNQTSSVQKYHCLNLTTKESHQIDSIDNFHPLILVGGVIDKDKAYLSLLNNEGLDNVYYMYEYDIIDNSLTVLDKSDSGFPVLHENTLYYLQIDNKKLETYLIQYDFESKEKKVLAYGNEQDGYFHNLTSDGERLILQVTKGHMNNFYTVHPDSDSVEGYVQIPGVDSFVGYPNHFTWIGEKGSKDRMRPQYYLLNSDQNILYQYNDSIIYPSSNGILWTKFLVKENEIPKGEIFNNKNTQLMWFNASN